MLMMLYVPLGRRTRKAYMRLLLEHPLNLFALWSAFHCRLLYGAMLPDFRWHGTAGVSCHDS